MFLSAHIHNNFTFTRIAFYCISICSRSMLHKTHFILLQHGVKKYVLTLKQKLQTVQQSVYNQVCHGVYIKKAKKPASFTVGLS